MISPINLAQQSMSKVSFRGTHNGLAQEKDAAPEARETYTAALKDVQAKRAVEENKSGFSAIA